MVTRTAGWTKAWRIASAMALTLAAVPADAEPTAAGTVIVNTARLAFGTGTDARSTVSNEVSLTVARIVDVAVTAATPSRPYGGDPRARVQFVVRNSGNASERFTLSAAVVPSLASVAGIVVDATGASPLGSGASTAIDLQPGEARTVYVLVDLASDARDDVSVTLSATAAAGHGAPGTSLGESPEAIVGSTGASASARTVLTGGIGGGTRPGTAGGEPTLAKSQSVRAPDGSARVMPGSVVTYRLDASFTAATAAVAIDDPVPAGTAYVFGSLTLDGAPLSDAGDADAGEFDGTAIHVALGDIAAAATRTIQFQAVIQ